MVSTIQTTASLRRDLTQNLMLHQIITLEPKLLSSLQVVEFSANQTVYDELDQIQCVYFPIDSIVSSLALLRDGTAVEVAMTGRESFVGISRLFGAENSRALTRMSLGGRLIRFESDALVSVFERNKLITRMIHQSYNTLMNQITQRSVCHARHSIRERFCCWLLMLHDRLGDRNLRLTQEVIARTLGVRRAGITIATGELFEQGAVQHRRGKLHIQNRAEIERLSCECYSVLSLRPNAETDIQPDRSTVVVPINGFQRAALTRATRLTRL